MEGEVVPSKCPSCCLGQAFSHHVSLSVDLLFGYPDVQQISGQERRIEDLILLFVLILTVSPNVLTQRLKE